MLAVTVTNTSATAAIGSGTSLPLPGCFSWMTLAASGSATVNVRMLDLEKQTSTLSGFAVIDILQQLVQTGQITLSWAAFSDTAFQRDQEGAAIHADTQ